MSQHDFRRLEQHYPSVIADMPRDFTSHQFILKLAQLQQDLYVDALSAYRGGAPFQAVHNQLSKALRKYPKLVAYRGEVNSEDIWRNSNRCASWRKL